MPLLPPVWAYETWSVTRHLGPENRWFRGIPNSTKHRDCLTELSEIHSTWRCCLAVFVPSPAGEYSVGSYRAGVAPACGNVSVRRLGCVGLTFVVQSPAFEGTVYGNGT